VSLKGKAPRGSYRTGRVGTDEERVLVIYPISGELLMPVHEYTRHKFQPPIESLPHIETNQGEAMTGPTGQFKPGKGGLS
jgi:hypothetical protein